MKRNLVFFFNIIGTALILFFANPVFACGGIGPCMGVERGEHHHARLTVYDSARQKIALPSHIGRTEVTTLEGKQSFCYDALHTHNTSGKLHIQISDNNDTTLGTFLGKWKPDLLEAKILVNEKRIKDPKHLNVRPEMDIKIFTSKPRR